MIGLVKLSGDHVATTASTFHPLRVAQNPQGHLLSNRGKLWEFMTLADRSSATSMRSVLKLPKALAKPLEDRNAELPITSSMQENDNWKGPQFQESVNLYDLEKMPLPFARFVSVLLMLIMNWFWKSNQESLNRNRLIHWYHQVILSCLPWFLGKRLSLIVEGSDLKIPSMSLAGKVDT